VALLTSVQQATMAEFRAVVVGVSLSSVVTKLTYPRAQTT
jgi:hypothetical protein